MPDQLHDKFTALLDNLWYTWNPRKSLPIIDLYGDGWRKNLPPRSFILDYGEARLNELLSSRKHDIEISYEQLQKYFKDEKWFDREFREDGVMQSLHKNPIAYFCLEYGLVDWLQIYSGGLGVLAGDYLKEASDLGLPMIGVGLFYHQGYFHQDFGEDGSQLERYLNQDPRDYPLELVRNEEGEPIIATIEIEDHEVYVRAWKLSVGKVELLLLDTNFDKNEVWEDRMITAHLYGGDQDTRIRQELVLGIGGVRVLEKMFVEPTMYHMNEGHSGFLALEVARQYISNEGLGFHDALKKATDKLAFTNHTLKAAGNDIFPYLLLEKYLSPYTDDLQTDFNTIFELGKDYKQGQEGFSMTILGLRNAKISNAVSIIHGKAAKNIWPDYDLVPVTNGVHVPTWVSPEIYKVIEKYLGSDWHERVSDIDFSQIQHIDSGELWHAHLARKNKLVNALNKSLDINLSANALTIAWSRRLTAYKRPDLIISDLERLKGIVNNSDQPVQILIAGKAHPRDTIGKELLQHMNYQLSEVCRDDLYSKVVIIPSYNWQLARYMVSGADVWLNTPFRYEEASGTSGMKACINGVLQFTTLDGWTDEVDWSDKGWVIAEEDSAGSLHDSLEHQITPMFFDTNLEGYNEEWIKRMKNSMQLVLENYSMTRMMKQYIEEIYRPIVTD